jgi:hypothetical protein
MPSGSASMPGAGRSCRKGDEHHGDPAWGGRRSDPGARAAGGGWAASSSGRSTFLGRHSVRAPERGPTFLRIRWWEGLQQADRPPILREATLCKLHRTEIALNFPDAQGCGQMGTRCEFCEAARPRRA